MRCGMVWYMVVCCDANVVLEYPEWRGMVWRQTWLCDEMQCGMCGTRECVLWDSGWNAMWDVWYVLWNVCCGIAWRVIIWICWCAWRGARWNVGVMWNGVPRCGGVIWCELWCECGMLQFQTWCDWNGRKMCDVVYGIVWNIASLYVECCT